MSQLQEWVAQRLAVPLIQQARAAADALKLLVIKTDDEAAMAVDFAGTAGKGLKELRELRRKALEPIEQQKRLVLSQIDPLIAALDEANKAGKNAAQAYKYHRELERTRLVAEEKRKAEEARQRAARDAALMDEPPPPALENVEALVPQTRDHMVRGTETVMYESGRWSCELTNWREADPFHLKITANTREALGAFQIAVRRGDIAPRQDGTPFEWQGFRFVFTKHMVERDARDLRPIDDRDPAIAGEQAYRQGTRLLEKNLTAALDKEGTR